MTPFLIYLFLCLALAYGWSDTEASRPFRNFIARIPYIRKPLLCHECSSFWISLGLSFLINPLNYFTYPILSNILCAFAGFFINLIFVRNHLIKYKDQI
jgi:hypothetical protein